MKYQIGQTKQASFFQMKNLNQSSLQNKKSTSQLYQNY